jgi:predicted transcriptional regulator
MKYKFYSKNSKSKEAIGKVEARSYREALIYFAGKKKLTVEEFNKLYEVTNKTDGKRFTFRRD